MTFTNRLGTIAPSFGTPLMNDTLYLSQNNVIAGGGAQTVTLSGLSPTVRAGYVRVKVYETSGSTPSVISAIVSFGDGTTTVYVAEIVPISSTPVSLSSTVWLDVVVPFLLDINASTCTVSVTMGGSSPACKVDVEIAATSGAS